ncbi:hypothetical protein B5G43_09535 [Flavonifractor sp. An92]|uniref:pyridoxamine 5'-phosphate oxidase family protein n=1 Tax=Flavonifractor sp. An92 TaxID=1965666 RepID=UPI000B382D5E|nr:pyridoxamine 5'-phosphate oxidase family protein [Flavonifractor sp. An92]OUN06396.1 hypothetical protein B5G43_09535 [Flavonifractor sp. An92]
MRRKEREMGLEFAHMVLDKAQWMTLSMVGVDGEPYCIPINVTRDGEYLYLHSAQRGEKAQCLRAHPRVCVSAVGDTRLVPERFTTEYESVVVRGTAEELTDPAEKQEALRIFTAKFCAPLGEAFQREVDDSLVRTAVFRIHMDEVTAKRVKFRPDGTELQFGAME